MKIETIDGGRHAVCPGMFYGRRPCGRVDELHDDSAVDIPGGVGVLGVHDLGHQDVAFS